MKIGSVLGIAVITLGLSLPAREADAALVIVDFSATVTEVLDPAGTLAGVVDLDDLITGTYIYDTTALDSLPEDPRVSEYLFSMPPSSFSMTVGGLTFQTDLSSVDVRATVFNDLFGDAFFVQSFNNEPVDVARVLLLTFTLQDPTGTAVSSDQLLTGAPDLASWAVREVSILTETSDPFSRYFIFGEITAVSLRPVPEPAGGLLVLSGLVAFGAARRWRSPRG